MKRRMNHQWKVVKKVAAVVSCAGVLAVSGWGCAKRQTPEELYKSVVEKNAKLSDMDLTMQTKMTMEQSGISLDVDMDMDMLMSGYNTSDMKYQVNMTAGLLGQEMEISSFYTDGYYYVESMGQKVKMAYDMDQIKELVEQQQSQMVSSEAMQELKVEKDGKNTRLSFTADPEKMTSYTENILKGMQGTMGNADFTIEKAGGSYLINPDGYYIESTVDMDMEMDMDGEAVGVTMKATSKVNNPGEKVKITLPDDLSSYTEVANDALS